MSFAAFIIAFLLGASAWGIACMVFPSRESD
jgi:hypothetical protein